MKTLMLAAAVLALTGGAAFAQSAATPLAKPVLRFIGTEDYTTEGGAWTRYRLVVDNEYEFDEALFKPAPDLPPCGRNAESSRAWVDIYSTEKRLYGFCALPSRSGLRMLWFALAQGSPPPPPVHIEITDRQTNRKAISNAVSFAKAAPGKPAAKAQPRQP